MFSMVDKEETAELNLELNCYNDYAEKIKLYRKEHNLKQEELAALMGVKYFTLRSWEQKQAKPPYHIWRRYKHLFDDTARFP